mmetsp:Transcript_24393/g.44112  ORF Transcript_24393/g.44112 Transcript_24393/m.44112 type:complete len:435 (-) Transcript_24393:20-1324(-)
MTLDLEPAFEDNTLCYIARYHVHVSVGTFVLFDHGESVSLGRILEVVEQSDGRQIVVNPFVKRSELAHPGVIVAGPSMHESCHYMQERIQSFTRQSIMSKDVTDIAFVFKEAAVVEGGITDICEGITNAFLIRFREDGTSIPSNECLAFPNDYAIVSKDFCFSRHVWNTLLRINVEISRILGSTNQSQGMSKRVKIGMDILAWRYIVEKSGEVGCRECQEVSLICWKRVTMPGLKIKKRVENNRSELIRFETVAELNGFAGLFGSRSVVNVRARLPFSRSREGRELRENDIINVVVGKDERDSPFRYRTTENGVDLIYDRVDKAVLSIRYSAYVFSSNGEHLSVMSERIIQRMCPDSVAEEVKEEEKAMENEERIIFVDSEFEHEGSVYRVTDVRNGEVICRVIHSNNAQLLQQAEHVFTNVVYVEQQVINRMN